MSGRLLCDAAFFDRDWDSLFLGLVVVKERDGQLIIAWHDVFRIPIRIDFVRAEPWQADGLRRR